MAPNLSSVFFSWPSSFFLFGYFFLLLLPGVFPFKTEPAWNVMVGAWEFSKFWLKNYRFL